MTGLQRNRLGCSVGFALRARASGDACAPVHNLKARSDYVLITAMPILKKRDHQTETRLLLESEEPVQLPPAEIDDNAILVQFERFKRFTPELLQQLRSGTAADPVPVMNDGSTFAIHGETRTFWVKLWHTAGTERTRIERAQVISCLPSTRGTTIVIDDELQD
jgi:hypothetical protein